MKKIIAVLLCMSLLFSLGACFGDDDDKNMNNSNGTNQSDTQNNNNGSSNGQNGSMNNNGGTNSGTMNPNTNGGANNNNMNGNTNAIEDLTDEERETLRSRIDAIDGITFSDLTFDGTNAMLRVESTLDEIGDDVRACETVIAELHK